MRTLELLGQAGRPVARSVMRVGGEVLGELEKRPRTKHELARRVGCGEMTVQRALTWLRECDVPIAFSRREGMVWSVGEVGRLGRWTLEDLVELGAINRGEAMALSLLCASRRMRPPGRHAPSPETCSHEGGIERCS